MSTAVQNVLAIGASRNIGYLSSVRFLASGATITFLLRFPNVFDNDQLIQDSVKSGKVRLVKGDALVQGDVQRAWDESAKFGKIDLLLFTVGGAPKFSLLKGFVTSPMNLVTQSLTNALCTIPSTQSSQLKIIIITANGVSHASHAALPLLPRFFFSHFLAIPHTDKLGAERVIAHCAGWEWDEKDPELSEAVMGSANWKEREGLPAPGTLKNFLVLRPAIFTDGDCEAEKKKGKKYRVAAGVLDGVWTISRKDVAHFVVDAAVNRWNEFQNKWVTIAY